MWVKENLILRNICRKEISFLKFKKKILRKDLFFKIKEFVDDRSDLYFRNSIIYLINKNYILFLSNMIVSSIFNPVRFIKKVISRFLSLILN